ncbi:MAG: META domain-containing protein [Bacteroidales bacterium]|nr:META domain-containing protein [Bacteroidales bacterium]
MKKSTKFIKIIITDSMKYNIKITFSILILLLVIVGCKTMVSRDSVENKPLIGTNWVLNAIEGKQIPEAEEKATILFNDVGQFNGSTGCNRFFGNFTFSKKSIKIDPTGATKKMCSNMDLEKIFFQTLNKDINRYVINKDTLLILSRKNELFRFIAEDIVEEEFIEEVE